MKILCVGGTFDANGGKPSSVFQKILRGFLIQQGIIASNLTTTVINGGTLEGLKILEFFALDPLNALDIILWMPNIDNSEDKILPTIKKRFPKALLISSKRVDGRDPISYFDLVSRLLKSHSNLGIVIEASNPKSVDLELIDPLGNSFCISSEPSAFGEILAIRVAELVKLHRKGSMKIGEVTPHLPEEQQLILTSFLKLIKQAGVKFTELVNAVNPDRFLGNASTRCMKGFPSMRVSDDNIFVTRRNVDKTALCLEDFVLVKSDTTKDNIEYFGDNKPSVDAPTQLVLFKALPKINYFIHGHVYIEGAPFTLTLHPCGAIEEASSILATIPNLRDVTKVLVNLKGHGCLFGASTLEDLDSLFATSTLVSRPLTENFVFGLRNTWYPTQYTTQGGSL